MSECKKSVHDEDEELPSSSKEQQMNSQFQNQVPCQSQAPVYKIQKFINKSGTANLGINNLEMMNTQSKTKLTFQVKDPIHTFTGREKVLKVLNESIKECRKKGAITSILSQTSTITGLGGVGKTETVRKYIKQFGNEYDSIIWIDAEHPSETTEQFKSLADQKLSIRLKDQEGKPRKFSYILEEIYEKLCEKQQQLLIVFDNAEAVDYENQLNDGIHQFLPEQTTTIKPPIVLVTSRQQNWEGVNVIQLDLWDIEECIQYILKRFKHEDTQENRKSANELAALFDRLPIAIQVAVSVILEQSNGSLKVADYHIKNLISDHTRGKVDLGENKQTISIQKLLDVSFDKLKQHNQGQLAIKMLVFMAYLSPTKIPKVIIQWLFPETDENLLNIAAMNLLGIVKQSAMQRVIISNM